MAPPPHDHPLSPRIDANLRTLRTAQSLQRHQEWVSQETREIPGLLSRAGFTLLGEVINPIATGGQAYVAMRQGQGVVAFRGSGGDNARETLLNALTDIRIRRVRPTEILDDPQERRARVHIGFYEAYLEFRKEIRRRIAPLRGQEVYVTGFSLGSALATLCALDLVVNDGLDVTLFGMGTPRVGNRAFIQLVERRVPHMLRAVLSTDPVTRVPAQIRGEKTFLHAGKLLELHDDGSPVPLRSVTGDLLARHRIGDHNRDKYASMLSALIKRVEADPETLRKVWGEQPLLQCAVHERGALEDYLDDDDDEDDNPTQQARR